MSFLIKKKTFKTNGRLSEAWWVSKTEYEVEDLSYEKVLLEPESEASIDKN